MGSLKSIVSCDFVIGTKHLVQVPNGQWISSLLFWVHRPVLHVIIPYDLSISRLTISLEEPFLLCSCCSMIQSSLKGQRNADWFWELLHVNIFLRYQYTVMQLSSVPLCFFVFCTFLWMQLLYTCLQKTRMNLVSDVFYWNFVSDRDVSIPFKIPLFTYSK